MKRLPNIVSREALECGSLLEFRFIFTSPSILGERSKWFDNLLATVGMNYKLKVLWCITFYKKIFKSIVLAKDI